MPEIFTSTITSVVKERRVSEGSKLSLCISVSDHFILRIDRYIMQYYLPAEAIICVYECVESKK